MPPRVIGLGPTYKILKLLTSTRLATAGVGFWETNEAFASQDVYSNGKLGLEYERVSFHGGDVSIVHHLGCGEYPSLSFLCLMRHIDRSRGVCSERNRLQRT